MERKIETTSTPLGPRALPHLRNQPARPQTLRQKPLFGETPITTDGEETELDKVSIPDLQPREQKISDTPIRKKGPEATVPTGRLHKEIIYEKGEFLAVRNTDDGFFLYQTTRNVYHSVGRIKIHWLTQSEANKQLYALDYHDHIEFQCILTNIRLTKISRNRFHLPEQEQDRIMQILKESIEASKKTTLGHMNTKRNNHESYREL